LLRREIIAAEGEKGGPDSGLALIHLRADTDRHVA
jgi:hypothetical protein